MEQKVKLWILRSVDRVKRCDMYICMYLPCMIYEYLRPPLEKAINAQQITIESSHDHALCPRTVIYRPIKPTSHAGDRYRTLPYHLYNAWDPIWQTGCCRCCCQCTALSTVRRASFASNQGSRGFYPDFKVQLSACKAMRR